MNEHEILIERIRTLLAAPLADVGRTALAEVEDVLTSGYARAHALEAERWRLERQMADVVTRFSGGDLELHASELTGLGGRAADAEQELAMLRALLAGLRKRADELRGAGSGRGAAR